MPIIKSAKKRVKVAHSANIRNSKTKRSMREAIKNFSKALSSGNVKQIEETKKAAVSAIDKASKKDVIHKNKAARVKASLASQAKAAGVKQTKTVKSAPAKKATSKAKSPAKKPVAKKTTKKTTK
jgi:small subunit ribosomal protein S20